jgi:hypothetical protein
MKFYYFYPVVIFNNRLLIRKLCILLSGAVIACMAGCSKKQDSFYLSAQVNSKNYSVAGCIISKFTDTATASTTTLIDGYVQTATSAAFPYVVLVLKDWTWTTGKIDLNNTKGFYALLYTGSGFAQKSEEPTIIINSVSISNVSGTFSFTGADGTVVSGGAFTAKRL